MMMWISLYPIYLLPLLNNKKTHIKFSLRFSKKNIQGSFAIENLLATALTLRETVARPSFSPSLPKKHACMQNSFVLSIHILCPDKVVLRGTVTVLSGDVEPWPLAASIVRPGKIIIKNNR